MSSKSLWSQNTQNGNELSDLRVLPLPPIAAKPSTTPKSPALVSGQALAEKTSKSMTKKSGEGSFGPAETELSCFPFLSFQK